MINIDEPFPHRIIIIYRKFEALGDPLTGISDHIDFEMIRRILLDLLENDTEKGRRPNYESVLMMKIMLLRQWHNLSDPQVGREIRDRISLLDFLGYPDRLPDRNTIWYFRERLSKTDKDRLVFNEIRDQITAERIRIREGTMQGSQRHNGSCIQKHSPDHGTGPQESQDLKEADTRRAAIFSDQESTEWWTHPCHHGDKGEGKDDICQYGIQSIHGGSPEEKGDDSVSAGNKGKARKRGEKKMEI